jgi:hypothetical protein
MRKYLFPIVVSVLAILNVILLWQNHQLKNIVSVSAVGRTHLINIDGVEADVRGAYTYPGIGAYFVPRDNNDQPVRTPLTLSIVFSAKSSCPASLSETEIYRRLIPILRERGQAIVAVTSDEDSTAIAEFLEKERLDIPLVALSSDVSEGDMNFEQMGISPYFMPFKILYDSTLTAIYMRGANNTPESQAEFERAVLWLSELIANGSSVFRSGMTTDSMPLKPVIR